MVLMVAHREYVIDVQNSETIRHTGFADHTDVGR